MWFIILSLSTRAIPGLSETIMQARFDTHADCMTEAAARAQALAEVGEHGEYLCMFHGESDRMLRRTAKGVF